MLRKNTLTIAALLFGAAFSGVISVEPAVAAEPPVKKVTIEQIDIAGRQRMLIQRIGRAACYVLGDIEADRNKKLALDGIAEFSNVQDRLLNGYEAKNWPAATNRILIANIEKVDRLWSTLKAADSQLAYGDFHTIVVHQVMALTDAVMEAADDTFKTLNDLTDFGTRDPSYVKTLNAVSRQRMLTQLASKEFCFAALVSGGEGERRVLAATIHEFDVEMENLLTGQNGLMEPPTILIKAQLEKAQRTWVKLAKLFDLAAQGQIVTEAQMIEAALLSEKVTSQVNAVVYAYVTHRP